MRMSGTPDGSKCTGESELFLGAVGALSVAGTSFTGQDPQRHYL